MAFCFFVPSCLVVKKLFVSQRPFPGLRQGRQNFILRLSALANNGIKFQQPDDDFQ